MAQNLNLCFLLAAGLGTRLRPWTDQRPKPALPFLNLPLMNYGFYLAHEAGCRNFLFNLHHLPAQIQSAAETLRPHCQSIAFSDETGEIQGSGGALDRARKTLQTQDAFLVANADEVLLDSRKPLELLFKSFQRDQPLATLLTCDHPDLLKKFNAVWVREGLVRGFGKEAPEPGCHPVHYTGYKIFSNRIFSFLPTGPSNIFYEVLVRAIASGEKVSHHHLGPTGWFETGDPESFLSAAKQVAIHHQGELKRVHGFFNSAIECVPGRTSEDVLVCQAPDRAHGASLNWRGLLCLGSESRVLGEHHLEDVVLEKHVTLKDPGRLARQLILQSPNPH